jgi:hypothetical protein
LAGRRRWQDQTGPGDAGDAKEGASGKSVLVGEAAHGILGSIMPKNNDVKKPDYAQQAMRAKFKNINIKNLSLKGRKPKA